MTDSFHPRIWYFTRFLPSLMKGGGSRRMMQIREALEDFDLTLFSHPRGDGLDPGKAIPCHPFPDLWGIGRRDAAGRLHAAGVQWAEKLAERRMPDFVLVDDPVYFPALMYELERRKVPVMAVCHNLESQVPSQVAGGRSFALLEKEVSILARCFRVITISRDETTFLTNQGIRTIYFPYSPPGEVFRRLLRVRRKRRWTRKSGLLLMGTAFNAETVEGMRKVVNLWENIDAGSGFGLLHVAGFNTEKHFPERKRHAGVRIHGTLEDADLDRLLARVRGCICHQDAGAGALTRIPEMLTAGLPVVASAHAARSHHHLDGVHEYSNLAGLLPVLKRIPTGSPARPPGVKFPFGELKAESQ